MNKRISKKLINSVLLGLGGFWFSLLSLQFSNPPFSITITWSHFLPLLAGMAYGPSYGLLSGILGLGAFYPFLIYQNNGWANLVNSAAVALWLVWYGYFEKIRQKKAAFWNHPLFVHLPFAVFYVFFMRSLYPIFFSFNPPFWNPGTELSMPIPILEGVITKGIIMMYLAVIVNVSLLKIEPVRELLGLETKRSYRYNGWIILGSVVSSLLFWYIVIIFNRVFIDKVFPERLFQIIDPHEIIGLMVSIPSGFFIGYIVCQFTESRLDIKEELLSSNEQLSQFMRHSPIYAYIKEVTPTQSLVLHASENYQEMIGIPGSQMAGKNMYELFPAELAAKMTADDWAVVSSGNILKLPEELNGRYYTTIKFPIRYGDQAFLAGYTIDITEQKNVEKQFEASQAELRLLLDGAELSRRALLSLVEDQKEAEEQIRQLNTELELRVNERTAQLAAANKELEAFAYSVSHDLRAPLRSLEGFSGALLDDCAGQLDPQGRHYLSRIQEASRRMDQLINDLLKLSQVTRAELRYQQVNLSELVQSITTELSEQSPGRRVDFIIAENMVVRGDANLLKIALENLLNNAYKFTGFRDSAVIEVGEIELAGERVFFVRDNGTGFNTEYAGKLFIPFQRLHSEKEFPGTGIGLSIVKRIITRHGGRIWPEAEVGRGTTFYFTLKSAQE